MSLDSTHCPCGEPYPRHLYDIWAEPGYTVHCEGCGETVFEVLEATHVEVPTEVAFTTSVNGEVVAYPFGLIEGGA